MAEKRIELKDFRDKNGEKYYPVSSFSKAVYMIAKLLVIISAGLYVLSVLGNLFVVLVRVVTNFMIRINDVNGTQPSAIDSFIHDLMNNIFPNYLSYEYHVGNFIDGLHLTSLAVLVLEGAGIFLLAYGITLMFRHHYGEQRPFFDDMESRQLKRDALKGLDVNYDANKIVNDDEAEKGRKRRVTQLEDDVKSTLKQMKVEVHTRRDLATSTDLREYVIKIPQPQGKKVRETVMRLIADLGGILTRSTDGVVKFGEMEIEVSGKAFVYKSSVDVQKVMKQSPKKKKDKKVVKPKTKTEYVYPLSLYNDNLSKIEGQTLKANEYAKNQLKAVEVYFTSENVPVNTKETNVGNTSVEYVFEIVRARKFSLGSMAENLETYLDITGVLVRLSGSSIGVTVPMPDEYVIPIDVPTMISSVF